LTQTQSAGNTLYCSYIKTRLLRHHKKNTEKKYIHIGRIIGAHGIAGEIKMETYTNSPDFIARFPRIIINGKEHRLNSMRRHKNLALITIEDYNSKDSADSLAGENVFAFIEDAGLESGEFFISEIIGFSAADADTGIIFGRVSDYLELPGHAVWVTTTESGEKLIPAAAEFVKTIDAEKRTVFFRLIEGL